MAFSPAQRAENIPGSPNNCEKTLAEMTNEEKNVISHRGIAVRKLKEFLLNKIC